VAITHTRRLRSGRSVWHARRLPALPERALTRDGKADVVVIGAGISGALVAEALVSAGLDVVIVDRRTALSGSTPASTALLQYEIDTPLSRLAGQIGLRRAQRIWRRSRMALDALRERTRQLGIDADCVNRDSLYLAGNLLDARGLAREAEARRRAGFEVAYLDAAEVRSRFGFRGRAALLGFDNLAADPRRLAAGYLVSAMAHGARLYTRTTVTAVQPARRGVGVTTADGVRLRARAVVFATGYELAKGVPRKGHRIASTWALATRPQPRALWPSECFVWEANDPYLYLRTTPDGRIVCGGEDEEFSDEASRDALLPSKLRTLQRKLRALWPACDPAADFAWCGSFGASRTGTPSIGRVPRMPNCYAVMGYGGNGITFSALAAQLLRTALTGGRDPDEDLFSFTRRW
jgi:glycine/D-amino acid oxidase-like deaminating enzyme